MRRKKSLDETRRRTRNAEFSGIELQLNPIGISCGIVGSRGVPSTSGKDDCIPFNENDRTGKRRPRIVDDVVPRRVTSNGGFSRYGGINGTDVSFGTRIGSIADIPRQGYKAYRRKNGKNNYYDDEFGESESRRSSPKKGRHIFDITPP